MIKFYTHAGGSCELELVCKDPAEEKWARTRVRALEWLRGTNDEDAAQLFESMPFELYQGTNGFEDEFIAAGTSGDGVASQGAVCCGQVCAQRAPAT